MTSLIYLDYHAATPLADGVLNAMHAAESIFANPSSVHSLGRRAGTLLEEARAQVAASIRARPDEIVWTSGGTEACWLGIFGLSAISDSSLSNRPIVTSSIEHPAVEAATRRLSNSNGAPLSHLSLRSIGFGEFHVPEGAHVAIQWVNHETGTTLPIRQLAKACKSQGAHLFIDATQAYGRLPIDVTELSELGVSAIALASHKIGGPSGAGALWIQRRFSQGLTPIFDGSQERGLRGGTPGLHSLIGFGAAAEQVEKRVESMSAIGVFRDYLEDAAIELGGVVNGAFSTQYPGFGRVQSASNISFPRWRSSSLVAALDLEGVCVSAGSACASGAEEESPVVRAIEAEFECDSNGVSNEPTNQFSRASSCVRFSFGPERLSMAQVEMATERLRTVVSRKRVAR